MKYHILMKYHTLFFFRKLGKMSQNLLSAAVVIGALSVINLEKKSSENAVCLSCLLYIFANII